jgi:P-type E1-E2 ATPase
LKLDYPENFEELFGRGIHATIKNKKYFFGKLKYIAEQHITIDENMKKNHAVFQEEGRTAVYLGDDKSLLGYIMFSDIVRPETRDMFASIEKHNIPNIIMLTGDKESVAGNIARKVGITEYHAELLPEQKVEWIKKIQKKYGPAAMVGDGVNDAPAMAISAVGIAMAAHGATVASETGDVVVVVNNVHRVHDVLHITQRSMKIAKQGIWFGMGVGTLLMILALLGYIAPVPGAITQEVLDVVVIINALKITFEKVA